MFAYHLLSGDIEHLGSVIAWTHAEWEHGKVYQLRIAGFVGPIYWYCSIQEGMWL